MKTTLLLMFLLALRASGEEIRLVGPSLAMRFEHTQRRLVLVQMGREGDKPFLYSDREGKIEGAGPVGNPFAVVIASGRFHGTFSPDSFHVLEVRHTASQMTAYLEHDSLPLFIALRVGVEGNVASWQAQVFWNGTEPVEMQIFLPLLSRVRFGGADRLIASEVSGSVMQPLDQLNYFDSYTGSLSAPFFLVEGGGRGLAVLDDNRTELAEDPSATAQRGQVVGTTFPLPAPNANTTTESALSSGPYLGVRYLRRFRGIGELMTAGPYDAAEKTPQPLPIRKLGDALDIGPVRIYAYDGTWRRGALWLREQRSNIPFRVSPARWFQNTTFISEDMGDDLVRKGMTFLDFPKILAAKRAMGADLFSIPGFHEPEILGTAYNFLNRGDYVLPAENLGGAEAARAGIAALHRENGHVLFYIEGLIVWKRSRVGRGDAKDWALMNQDGTYYESYQGFWHMCPAVKEWQEWFAKTAAEIVRTTGVDGFFVDSLLATDNHRCFNPAHHHPHPDVWTWGVRQTLRRLREELDRINPEAVIFTEGEGDIAREFVDGFITHSAFWNHGTFTEPLTRFVYPRMNAFESWGYGDNPQTALLFNAVNGFPIYAHNSHTEMMAPYSRRVRDYYDVYPEITEAQLSEREPVCPSCLAAVFDGTKTIVTVANPKSTAQTVAIKIPAEGTILFDRYTGQRIPSRDAEFHVALQPWEFRAFEVRP